MSEEVVTAYPSLVRNVWAVRPERLAAAFVLGLMWIVPQLVGGFTIYLWTIVALYAVAALSLQVMTGLAGQLSLGQAAFVGIGAYTAALLERNMQIPFVVSSIAGALFTAAVAYIMASLVRLSGVYFKIATFGLGVIIFQIFSNWTSVTGGSNGLTGIPAITILGFTFDTTERMFMLAMTFLTIAYIVFSRLTDGGIGRALRAIGQNEIAARSVGIPATRYKMAIIIIACGFTGWAGTMLPHVYGFINPDSFTWHESIALLIMVTIGGHGSLIGAIIGAILVVVVPEYLRDFAQYKMLAYGILLIVSMMYLPRGIIGLAQAGIEKLGFGGIWVRRL